jgi:4-amino-4-deoxy-L-arabinose transferase-like glycosyltransferase
LNIKFHIWWFILFGLLAILFAKNTSPLPSGVHSWAQADRYSLACQYFEDGRFLSPKTFNLMSEEGRVGVEFPILPYISAKLAKFIGRNNLPWIMRILNSILLLISFVVLAAQMRGSVFHKSSMIAMLFLSPMLVFYGFNFLPDTTGLALVLMSFAALLRFSRIRSNVNWVLALVLAACATLIKTTCGIYFIAIGAVLLLHFVREKNYKQIVYLTLSQLLLAAIVIWYDYTFFFSVNKKFWAIIFMSQSQPILNWSDLSSVYSGFVYWFGQWITWSQASVLILISVVLRFTASTDNKNKLLRQLILISLIGVVAFIGLMGKQFVNHDYYFIASVIPLLFLIGVNLNDQMAEDSGPLKRLYPLFLAIGLVLSGLHSFSQYPERSGSHYTWKGRTILNDTRWMEKGDSRLTKLGIESEAIVFVLYEFAPNTSLVYFNRKGRVFNHEEMTREDKNLTYWNDRIKPKYVVIQKKWIDHLESDQPKFFNLLKPFGNNLDVAVYTFN